MESPPCFLLYLEWFGFRAARALSHSERPLLAAQPAGTKCTPSLALHENCLAASKSHISFLDDLASLITRRDSRCPRDTCR